MAFLNQAVVEGARIIARQALSTGTDKILSISSPTLSPTATSAFVSSTPGTTTATSSSASASDTNVSNGSPGGGNSPQQSPNSSPLLFFVALGFGVVFTNLWIIVGVKYCFRYNARNRAMRLNEDGEPINLENMPRPHRRRREKKLMTMEEVNEKFPMQKYKNWVAGRAQEGLPTLGGVTAPPSRSNSVRDVKGVVPELPSKERDSTEERPATSGTSNAKPANKTKDDKTETGHQTKESTSSTVAGSLHATTEQQDYATMPDSKSQPEPLSKTRDSQDDEDEDDDEHIDAALSPECMGTSGDTCAICIDTLEDDDDVRGLTCGHTFHAVCVDPWLTSRRACCPLCKADYYTPKPRPVPADGGDGTTPVVVVPLNGAGHRMNMRNRPGASWIGIRGQAGHFLPSRRLVSNQAQGGTIHSQPATERTGSQFGFFGRYRLYADSAAPVMSPTVQAREAQNPTHSRGWFSDLRPGFPLRAGRRQNAQSSSDGPVASAATNSEVTPSNLEAGVRPVESR